MITDYLKATTNSVFDMHILYRLFVLPIERRKLCLCVSTCLNVLGFELGEPVLDFFVEMKAILNVRV